MSDTVKMIVEIPEEQYKRIVKAPRCINFSEAIEDRIILCKAIKNGTPVNPATNGEMIKAIANIKEDRISMNTFTVVILDSNGDVLMDVSRDWWDSPCGAESEK